MQLAEKFKTCSVVMITYNHEKYIKQAIEGVLIQETDFDIELIISNDASTDKTDEIIENCIKDYQGNITIKYHNQKNNKGALQNWTWTLEQVKGKYIAICEGDDYWTDPLKLQKQVDFLEKNEEYVVCSHNRIRVDQNNKIIVHNEFEHFGKKNLFTQCILFKNIFPDELYFSYAKKIFNGDTFLFLYLEQFGKIGFLDFIGAAYRISDTGIWSKIDKKKQYELSRKSLEQILLYFQNVDNKKQVLKIKKYLANLEIHLLTSLLKQNDLLGVLKKLYMFNKINLKNKIFTITNLKINIFYIIKAIKLIIKKIKFKLQQYYQFYLKRYKYHNDLYPETFLSNFPKEKNTKLDKAPEVIYTFWTGDNPLTPNRKKGLDSLKKYSRVKVQLITPDNLPDYIKKEHPLHPAYEYLSLVHKSDYLRGYFMYYYGGGYADIKKYSKSWQAPFKKLNTSPDKWALGYQELGAWGVPKIKGKLGKDLKLNYLYLFGNVSFIYKPQSPIAKEWLTEVEKRLDEYLSKLQKDPAKDFFGKNKNYPIPWSFILGQVMQPLLLKYYDRILFSKSILPSMKDCR